MIVKNLPIKMWAEDDRPREKMMLKGRNSLSNAELLAILIGSGTKRKTALEVAQELLNLYDNNLQTLSRCSIEEFKKISGIGDAKAITLQAALELGRRRKEDTKDEVKKISSAKHAYKILRPYFDDLNHEEFRVLALSNALNVIGNELISKGGFTGTVADGKMIFKYLLDKKACACILAHNHPSGTLKPSDADIRLTKNLHEFGRMIGIDVVDHLILVENDFVSLKESGYF